jgi:hypothetical protein
MRVCDERPIEHLHRYLGRSPGTPGKARYYEGDVNLHGLIEAIEARWPGTVGRHVRLVSNGDRLALVGDADADLGRFDEVVLAHAAAAPGLYQELFPEQTASAAWLRDWRRDPRAKLTRDVIVHLLRVLGV